jgi:hypothetical protein
MSCPLRFIENARKVLQGPTLLHDQKLNPASFYNVEYLALLAKLYDSYLLSQHPIEVTFRLLSPVAGHKSHVSLANIDELHVLLLFYTTMRT